MYIFLHNRKVDKYSRKKKRFSPVSLTWKDILCKNTIFLTSLRGKIMVLPSSPIIVCWQHQHTELHIVITVLQKSKDSSQSKIALSWVPEMAHPMHLLHSSPFGRHQLLAAIRGRAAYRRNSWHHLQYSLSQTDTAHRPPESNCEQHHARAMQHRGATRDKDYLF